MRDSYLTVADPPQEFLEESKEDPEQEMREQLKNLIDKEKLV